MSNQLTYAENLAVISVDGPPGSGKDEVMKVMIDRGNTTHKYTVLDSSESKCELKFFSTNLYLRTRGRTDTYYDFLFHYLKIRSRILKKALLDAKKDEVKYYDISNLYFFVFSLRCIAG